MSDSSSARIMQYTVAVASGILFGLGLGFSQMIDPAKVLAFLDVAGSWDPTLALVMIGALTVTFPGFPLVLRRASPILAGGFMLTSKKDVDARLLGGAVLFGVGWGIGGLCPGPAIAALVTARPSILIFVVGMVAGMAAYRLLDLPPAP